MSNYLTKKNLYVFLGLSFAVKLLLSYIVPVFADETYYYIWSLHPQLSYFDHPPMVSWFIYLSHLFLPAGNPLALRFSFVLASLLISLIWLKILEHKNFSLQSIYIFLSLYFLNPLLGIGAIVATPDTPLVLFWSLSYLCFIKVVDEKKLIWSILLGISLGLGFCSKYHIVLLVLSGLIYLIYSKKILTIRPFGVLLTLVFGALFCSPVLIWNAQNQWSSFLFQINHGFGEDPFEWSWVINYVFTQALLLGPFVLMSLFKKSQDSREQVFSLSQLFFFLTSAFKSVVEGNWPITSHLHSIANFSENSVLKKFKLSVIYWAFIYALVFLFLLLPASKAVRKNMVNSSHLEDLISLVDQYTPLYGPNYQFASLLSWKTQKNIPKLRDLSRHDFYDSLPDSIPQTQVFYVLKYDYSEWPANYEHYKKIKLQNFDNTGLELYQFQYE